MLVLAAVLTFVLAGQSNMVGNGPIPAAPINNTGVTMLGLDGTWQPATEPMPQGIVDAPYANQPGTGAGAAIPFADQIIADGKASAVRLIPCSVNGSPIAAWVPGGDLLRACLARIAGPVDGVLFFQGESDGYQQQTAATWGQQFGSFVAGVRAQLGSVPIVFAQLGPTQPAVAVENDLYFQAVKDQQAAVSIPNVSMIHTDDLTVQPDGFHFDTASYRTIGRRFAGALEPLLAPPAPAAAPAPVVTPLAVPPAPAATPAPPAPVAPPVVAPPAATVPQPAILPTAVPPWLLALAARSSGLNALYRLGA